MISILNFSSIIIIIIIIIVIFFITIILAKDAILDRLISQ